MVRQRQAQAHGDTESPADATALGSLAKCGQLCVVEGALEDQLRVDGYEPTLRLGRSKSSRELPEGPLLSLGEPPNVGELSGADGAEEHLGR
jgi:hypothetical protein